MPSYSNLSGRSGIESYDLGDRSISVTFTSGRTYSYNHETVGKDHVDAMTDCAQAGIGLNSYINDHLKVDPSTNWWSGRRSPRRRLGRGGGRRK